MSDLPRQMQLTAQFAVSEKPVAEDWPKLLRWSTMRDSKALVKTIVDHFGGKVPQSAVEVRTLGADIPGALEGHV